MADLSDSLASWDWASPAADQAAPAGIQWVEEPVPLDVFIKDQKYLKNPPLSEEQYLAVQHAERIFFPATYEELAVSSSPEIREYWSQPVRMVNFITLQWGKGCLVAGEEFYDARTGRWVHPEDSCEDGGLVASMSAPGGLRVSGRVAFFKVGSGRCRRVRTRSGYVLTVHEHHQFLTRGSPEGEPFWRCLTQMSPGDWVATSRVLPEPAEPLVLDEREVELVGLWLGDGSMPQRRIRGKYETWTSLRMTIGFGAPVELGRYLRLLRSYDHEPGIRTTRKWTISCGYGSGAGLVARRWGLFGKTFRDKRVPPEMMGLRRDQVALLLSRLVDTDGSVYFEPTGRPRIEYSSVSEGLVLDVQRLMLRLGARSVVRERTTKCQQGGCVGHRSWRLVVHDDLSLLVLSRELSLLDKQARLDDVRDWAQDRHIGSGALYWDRIDTMLDIGVQEFYDTVVPGDHNYLTTGLLNHNGGKDHTCRTMSARVAYLLLCLPSPQEYYGFAAQDEIHLINVASSAPQANRAFFGPLRRAVMRPGCWLGSYANPLVGVIEYSNGVHAISGHSDAETQEGLNVLLGVADELDAFKRQEELEVHRSSISRESTKSAEAILKMLRTSMMTRFPQVGKNVRISYPRYKGSMIQQLTAEARKEQERRGEVSRNYVSGPLCTWDVNPLRSREDFAQEYEDDPVLARARYECDPAAAVNPYFSNEVAIESCVEEVEQEPLRVRYEPQAHKVLHPDGEQAFVRSWTTVYDFAASLLPKRGAVYAMHADLAVRKDRAGVCMAHVSSMEEQEVIGKDPTGTDIVMSERRPVVKVDFLFAYEADLGISPPREIQVRWARELCLELRRRGFNVRWFSFDGYQSVDSMQILESNGIETKRVSTDISIEPYRGLRDMFNEGRVRLPLCYPPDRDPAVLRELYGLNKLASGKLDHQAGSSKDMADALACAVQGAIQQGGQEDGGIAYLGTDNFVVGEGMALPQGFIPPMAVSAGGFTPDQAMIGRLDLGDWENLILGPDAYDDRPPQQFSGPARPD